MSYCNCHDVREGYKLSRNPKLWEAESTGGIRTNCLRLLKKSFWHLKEDVPEGSTVDKIIDCPWSDVNLVLKGWKIIMANFKKISLGVSHKFFLEYPACKSLFTSFSDVQDYDLPYNEDYLRHAYAVMKGINSIMMNLSGEYEEENEILPTIGITHLQRDISLSMMRQMKDAIVFVCCDFLNLSKREKASWVVVMNYIFEDYICRTFPKPESETAFGES